MTNAQVITASAEPRIGWRNEGDDAMNTIEMPDGQFTFDFQPDDEKEHREQRIVDPVQQ